MKRITVTGGAGFIGGALARRLRAQGDQVRVIDNLWRGSLSNLTDDDGRPVLDVRKEFHLADLCDYASCLALLRDADVVYHLADVVGGIQFVFGNELFVFRQNVVMNSNVLAACLFNKVPKYVYVGTACSYPRSRQMGTGVVAFREEEAYPAEPESTYGWSKLMGEYEALQAQKAGGIQVGLLRLHNVYGPRCSLDTERAQVIPSLILKALAHPVQPFVVWGSGQQYRDFVYVEDVVEGLLAVADRGMDKGVIQLGSERAVSIAEAAEQVIRLSGKTIIPEFDRSRPEGDRGRIAIGDRARDILQWRASVSFEQGLQRTYEWIAEEVKRNTNRAA